MCGITGFISSKLNDINLKEMVSSIKHRGPDSDGYFYNSNFKLGLGHRRLSIL